MSNLYRAASPRTRRPESSRFLAAVKIIALLAVAIGIFMLAVRWFRRDVAPEAALLDTTEETAQNADVAASVATALAVPEQTSITLAAVDGETGTATAIRTHQYGEYALTVVADLPTVDADITAYEAWFVTPGITDFFSLGEMLLREDGKWGLVWSQTDALVRSDIAEFNRIIIIREPRDGEAAPSADHVLSGTFE